MSKKIKIVLGLFSLIIVVEGWIIYLTNNIEKRIIPSNSFLFDNFTDTFVSAQGTWMSDMNLASPIQSSDITCLKDSMLCVEARGEITAYNNLIVDTYLFDIETWNEREIVTKPHDSGAGCTRYIMRLDRIQKQVSATRTTIKNTDLCDGVSNEPMHLYLGNGFDAWKKVRSK